jgi:hypothetical protein
MDRQVFTVSPSQGKWKIEGGSSGAEFEKQSEAIEEGRKLARETWEKDHVPSQLRIKGEDGTFRDEHTYGDDPTKYES